MWNGISDPEISKFSLWFCESPPRLLGEHSMRYIEADDSSTVSSQGLEEGEERISLGFFLWVEDASSLMSRLSVPLQWREQI